MWLLFGFSPQAAFHLSPRLTNKFIFVNVGGVGTAKGLTNVAEYLGLSNFPRMPALYKNNAVARSRNGSTYLHSQWLLS